MITGGDLRQSRLDVGYKTFTISPWVFIHLLKSLAQNNNAENTSLHCDGLTDSIVLIAVMTNIAS